MFRNIVIGMSVILIAVGIFWMLSGKESKAGETKFSSAANREGDNEDKVAQLETELAQMKKDMKRVSLQSNMAAAQMSGGMMPVAAQAEDRPEEGKPGETPEEYQARVEKQRQETIVRYEKLEKVLQREVRDPVWAERAETEIGTILQQMNESGIKGANVLSSECRSNMCKIDMTYNDLQTQTQVGGRVRSHFFGFGESRKFEENGQLRTTTYIYRQGYEPPVQ